MNTKEFKYEIGFSEKIDLLYHLFLFFLALIIISKYSSAKIDWITLLKKFPNKEDSDLYFSIFIISSPIIIYIIKQCIELLIKLPARLITNKEGINFIHPYYSLVNWEIK